MSVSIAAPTNTFDIKNIPNKSTFLITAPDTKTSHDLATKIVNEKELKEGFVIEDEEGKHYNEFVEYMKANVFNSHKYVIWLNPLNRQLFRTVVNNASHYNFTLVLVYENKSVTKKTECPTCECDCKTSRFAFPLSCRGGLNYTLIVENTELNDEKLRTHLNSCCYEKGIYEKAIVNQLY